MPLTTLLLTTGSRDIEYARKRLQDNALALVHGNVISQLRGSACSGTVKCEPVPKWRIGQFTLQPVRCITRVSAFGRFQQIYGSGLYTGQELSSKERPPSCQKKGHNPPIYAYPQTFFWLFFAFFQGPLSGMIMTLLFRYWWIALLPMVIPGSLVRMPGTERSPLSLP